MPVKEGNLILYTSLENSSVLIAACFNMECKVFKASSRR